MDGCLQSFGEQLTLLPLIRHKWCTDEGFQNVDASGDYEKNKDEGDFSFAYSNPDRSLISTDDIFQNGHIRSVLSIFNRNLLFVDAENDDSFRARGAAASSSSLRPPLKKLFFEERDMPTSTTLFYNS
ncbi:uncharacterized protein LOC18777788 [Prunus persica]|uniref:uncharacterized protein LOC18777788 n=1 Tax=Prunus persica TaxID=3760 RepID=UPI0009AB857E|nr:uncharacterized protein LOC18777788 [Prunus persica]